MNPFDMGDDDLDAEDTEKLSSMLVHLYGWVPPDIARMMVAEHLARRRDLMVRSPAGKQVRIQVLELMPDIQAFIDEHDEPLTDEEAATLPPLPGGLKKSVVTEAFVRRYTEAEFAAMLRRVKRVW